MRYRLRKPPAPTPTTLITPPTGKRRGRAPSYIPDPWSDLEWEAHPEAREVVRLHPAGMTLEEIGAVMNITRERVRQIESAALRKLASDTGSDIFPFQGFTIAIPECTKCGEPFVRGTGRQTLCAPCDAVRKRKRRHSPMMAAHLAAMASP